MHLYFALSYSPFSELKQLDDWKITKALLSYHVLRKTKSSADKMNNQKSSRKMFFLDSGAFSAFTKGVDIQIDEYIDFIKKTKDVWEVYAGLDVIGDCEKTRTNVEWMEKAGISPLPTFHAGSPLEELDRMCKKYDYIALGGLVPLAIRRKKMQKWLDKCFSIIFKNLGKNGEITKIHGFGVNALWAWKRYPFYSVDTTGWNQGSKFGRTIDAIGIDKLQPITYKNNPIRFAHMKRGNWRTRTDYNIKAFLKMESDITRLWDERNISFKK